MSNTTAQTKSLTIERIFDAPLALVWKAWSDEELLKKWWGPRNWSAPTVKIDFREGGKYLLAMRGQMGPGMPEVTTWSGGTYIEIDPMNKIRVLDHFADQQGKQIHASQYGLPESFPMESEITITFSAISGSASGGEETSDAKTKLTIYYPDITGIEGEMLKNMTMGWNQSLDKLAEALQK